MAIFQPVNMTGPAHRGPQIQQLAQQAAQNVMRRQRMRSMLKTSAAAARGAVPGGGQGLMTAQRGVHTVLSHPGLVPNMGSAFAPGSNTVGPASPQDPGLYNAAGGGADFQSLPDPTDPSQSPASVGGPVQIPLPPGFGSAPGGPEFNPGVGGGSSGPIASPGLGGSVGGPIYTPGVGGSSGGLIPLNGGLFYDPATDSVVGGGGGSRGQMTS